MTKNYLVIGASSGIGEAIASQLQREGHQVFSASRNTPKVEGVTHLTWDASAPDASVFSQLPESLDGWYIALVQSI
jgi:NAD(P)-dependent dehydrogenase (short-subunit alcohol dehydrogenase family)